MRFRDSKNKLTNYNLELMLLAFPGYENEEEVEEILVDEQKYQYRHSAQPKKHNPLSLEEIKAGLPIIPYQAITELCAFERSRSSYVRSGTSTTDPSTDVAAGN
ncbi:hypothetical protein GWI33_005166 [Rhynchophorus ferrugineus]|uniref:Uncharacterized protein n=1 Tax=Rhynchophorus ferrugineus TaxID=354439 RepID=A0A834INQ3_RHYFE|nr:hypothetical protein GWI33_005166 [Rhynchophorus ferrugineus]